MNDTVEPKKHSSNFDQQIEQARQRINTAAAAGDKDGQAQGTLELLKVLIDSGTLDNLSEEVVNKLQKVAPHLIENLAKVRVSLAEDGGKKTLELIKALRDSQRELLKKESGDVFDLMKSGYGSSISLLGTFKGFALLLEAFGIDTKEFVAKCDDMILAEKGKIPKINDGRLKDARLDVSSIAAEQGVDAATGRAIQDIVDKTPEVTKVLLEIADKAKPKNAAPAAPAANSTTADIETTRLINAARTITAADGGSGVAAKVDLGKMITGVAKSDGNASTISLKEQDLLVAAVEMGLKNKGVDNSAEIAQNLVRKVREEAMAGPAPAPR